MYINVNNSELINQDSGDFEYYTPIEIIEAARKTMGTIDLDPASSVLANKRIGASNIYTIEQNGLMLEWLGNIWLNHPFSRSGNKLWINKAVLEYDMGNAQNLICITYASTSEKWFQPLLKFPQCFLSPRINYYLPDGTLKRGVTKGSVVTYLGKDKAKFAECFEGMGYIK